MELLENIILCVAASFVRAMSSHMRMFRLLLLTVLHVLLLISGPGIRKCYKDKINVVIVTQRTLALRIQRGVAPWYTQPWQLWSRRRLSAQRVRRRAGPSAKAKQPQPPAIHNATLTRQIVSDKPLSLLESCAIINQSNLISVEITYNGFMK